MHHHALKFAKMLHMKHQPEQWALPRSAFGRIDVISWEPPPPSQSGIEHLFRSAVYQHVLAFRVRQKMLREEHTAEQAIFDMPVNAARLGRLLRGELPMTFAEMLAMQSYVGGRGLVEPGKLVRANLDKMEADGIAALEADEDGFGAADA